MLKQTDHALARLSQRRNQAFRFRHTHLLRVADDLMKALGMRTSWLNKAGDKLLTNKLDRLRSYFCQATEPQTALPIMAKILSHIRRKRLRQLLAGSTRTKLLGLIQRLKVPNRKFDEKIVHELCEQFAETMRLVFAKLDNAPA